MGKWPHADRIFQDRLFNQSRQNLTAIPHLAVFDDRIRTDFTAFADGGRAAQVGIGPDDRILPDAHAGLDIGGFGVDQGHPG